MTDAERIAALEQRASVLEVQLNQATTLLNGVADLVTQMVEERNAAVEHYRPELEALAKQAPPQ